MNRRNKETRQLPVKLTDEEFKLRSSELASAIVEYREREESIKDAKKAFSDELKKMQTELNILADIVDQRRELRTVPCSWFADYQRNMWRLTRDDTGTEVASVTMTSNELQEDLDWGAPIESQDTFDKETGETYEEKN